jgi:iron complex outermembrane receptor protein
MHGGSISDVGSNWHKDIANAWTPENPYTSVPRLNNQDQYTNASSNRWLISSNYLSLDNITLGYSFEGFGKGESYKGVSGRLYATVSNVFTITNYDGIDPEIGNGYDNELYPRPLSFIVGLNLNF